MFDRCDMIMKVKQPPESECELIRPDIYYSPTSISPPREA